MIPNQQLYRGQILKYHFMVHISKITRLLSPISAFDGESPKDRSCSHTIRVTVLYGSKQVVLGNFPVVANECIINQKLTCVFNLTKSGAPSKLHFYIDQTCSSGLTGHLALDLKEFVQENGIVYLKYPLCPNASNGYRGPILKMTIQNVGRMANGDFNGSDDIVVCRSSLEGCHDYGSQGSFPSPSISMSHLVQLENALANFNEKLKVLTSTCKETERFQNSSNLSCEHDTQSNINSPLFSSLQTGTSADGCSELCEDTSTEADDVFDPCLEYQRASLHAKHMRTSSNISILSSAMNATSQIAKHGRSQSMGRLLSDHPRSLEGTVDERHNSEAYVDDCWICSTSSLQYRGISSSMQRCNDPALLQDFPSQTVKPLENTFPTREELPPTAVVVKKGPGFLKSLFGAAVVAGVSFFGLKNVHKSQMVNNKRVPSKYTSNAKGRLSKRHYSFRL